MTPSNPSNSQPLIYRIMDALGVTHLVACINHTHEQSEVEGLPAALGTKANKVNTDLTEVMYMGAGDKIDLDTMFGDDHDLSHIIVANNSSDNPVISELFLTSNGNLHVTAEDKDRQLPSGYYGLYKVVNWQEGGSTFHYFVVLEGIYSM